jgi:NAD(P)H-hydrate repair Nnr-like enzyme with NAD(P)H-hydrate epimerase domain
LREDVPDRNGGDGLGAGSPCREEEARIAVLLVARRKDGEELIYALA